MAETFFVFPQKQRAMLGTIILDASLSEMHSSDAYVTEHPVERGADITDHVRPRLVTLAIEGVITFADIGGAGGGVPPPEAFLQLRTLLENGDPITVVTALKTYDNMILTSLQVPRDAKTGDALRFTANLRQVRLADSKTVQPPTKSTRGQGKVNKGRQNPTVATPQQSSALLKGLQFIGVEK